MKNSVKSIRSIVAGYGIRFNGEMLEFPVEGGFMDLIQAFIREENKAEKPSRKIASSFERMFPGFHSQDAERERLFAEAEAKGGFSEKNDPSSLFLPGWMLRSTLNAMGRVKVGGQVFEYSVNGVKTLNEKGKWEEVKPPANPANEVKSSPFCCAWSKVVPRDLQFGNNLRRIRGRLAVVPMGVGKLYTTETIHFSRASANALWFRTPVPWISAWAQIQVSEVTCDNVVRNSSLFNARANAREVSDSVWHLTLPPQFARSFIGFHDVAGGPGLNTDIC